MKSSEIPAVTSIPSEAEVVALATISPGFRRLRRIPMELIAQLVPPGPKGDKGDTGDTGAGTPGTDGTPGTVWRVGVGPPANSLGVNGDFFLDIIFGFVYVKSAGTYAIEADIQGPAGPAGPAGPPGSGGGGFAFNYLVPTAVVVPVPGPASGHVAFGGVDGEFYLNRTDNDGKDITSTLGRLEPGDWLFVLDPSDPTHYRLLRIERYGDVVATFITYRSSTLASGGAAFTGEEAVVLQPLMQKASTYKLWDAIAAVGTATYTIDLRRGPYNSLDLTGNPTFATTNGDYNRNALWKITADGTDRILTFPAGWVFIGSPKPTILSAGMTALLKLHVYGETEADVLAEWVLQNPPGEEFSHTTLAYAGTTNIDFALDDYRTLTLAGNITFTSSNLQAPRSVSVRIIGDGSSRTLTFPAGWKFIGATAPASLAANKIAVLSVTSFGTTDANVVAAYSAEP